MQQQILEALARHGIDPGERDRRQLSVRVEGRAGFQAPGHGAGASGRPAGSGWVGECPGRRPRRRTAPFLAMARGTARPRAAVAANSASRGGLQCDRGIDSRMRGQPRNPGRRTEARGLRRCARRDGAQADRRAATRARHASLLRLGMSRDAIDNRVKSRRFRPFRRGIYLLPNDSTPRAGAGGHPLVPRASVLFGQRAAYLHELLPYPAQPRLVHVAVPGNDPGSQARDRDPPRPDLTSGMHDPPRHADHHPRSYDPGPGGGARSAGARAGGRRGPSPQHGLRRQLACTIGSPSSWRGHAGPARAAQRRALFRVPAL